MNDIPTGFDGTYRCRHHSKREAVAPIALRLCLECLVAAHANYSEQRTQHGRDLPNLSTDGRNIDKDHQGHYRPRKERTI